MKNTTSIGAVLAASLLLSACGKQDVTATAETERLTADNAKLQAEVVALRKQVEELSLTPQLLLARVNEALVADKTVEARQASDTLDKRFADSAQAKAAKAALTKYEAAVAEREAQAKALEARGFYALQPQSAPTISGVTVRVESLQLGKRWQFDAQSDESYYRDAERGERFVLMRSTVQSTDKNPKLPDVGVYRIDGKKMTLLALMSYEFRRWSSYGTFIGLYHDFKNDFAHTPAVPFNAAARVSDEDASKPFAVVVTGELCHERGSKSGQPEVVYRRLVSCASKTDLEVDDFAKGGYRVLAFFNRPKGV